MSRRTFTRTEAALAAYDAAGEAMDVLPAEATSADALAVVRAWDAALAAAGEAFAADTLDINPNGVGTFQHFGPGHNSRTCFRKPVDGRRCRRSAIFVARIYPSAGVRKKV